MSDQDRDNRQEVRNAELSEAKTATPSVELERCLLDPCIPKNEVEHYAARIIIELRDQIRRMSAGDPQADELIALAEEIGSQLAQPHPACARRPGALCSWCKAATDKAAHIIQCWEAKRSAGRIHQAGSVPCYCTVHDGALNDARPCVPNSDDGQPERSDGRIEAGSGNSQPFTASKQCCNCGEITDGEPTRKCQRCGVAWHYLKGAVDANRALDEAERKLGVVQEHYRLLESLNFDLTHQLEAARAAETMIANLERTAREHAECLRVRKDEAEAIIEQCMTALRERPRQWHLLPAAISDLQSRELTEEGAAKAAREIAGLYNLAQTHHCVNAILSARGN